MIYTYRYVHEYAIMPTANRLSNDTHNTEFSLAIAIMLPRLQAGKEHKQKGNSLDKHKFYTQLISTNQRSEK